jgi:hypothetical protein
MGNDVATDSGANTAGRKLRRGLRAGPHSPIGRGSGLKIRQVWVRVPVGALTSLQVAPIFTRDHEPWKHGSAAGSTPDQQSRDLNRRGGGLGKATPRCRPTGLTYWP